MRRTQLLLSSVCFATLSLLVTYRVAAIIENNSVCNPSGGCQYPCINGRSGSARTISASQLSECSPQYMSNCPGGNNYGVCGVSYTYTGPDCDATTINNSSYVYSYYCN